MTNTASQPISTGLLPELIAIKGGEFEMGSNKSYLEQLIHRVAVPSFYLGRYPITNQQFLPFLHEKGNQAEGGTTWVNINVSYNGVNCGIEQVKGGFACIRGQENHPMIYVSWYGARAYCNWLSEKTGKNFRLPSESEWEYAAKGGSNKHNFQYSGSNHLSEVGWHTGNSHGQTKPVGLKYPNPLDLYDMSGNVWEWCADHWHENYEGAPKDGSAWIKGGDQKRRVVRGGSWNGNDSFCRVSDRTRSTTDIRYMNIGFRVSRY